MLNAVDQSTCAQCGAELPQNIKFCPKCGTAVPAADVTVSADKRRSNGYGSLIERVKTFENGRHLIVNLMVALCAFVIIFISLFAPIKTVACVDRKLAPSWAEKPNGETHFVFFEIDQSVWKMLGAVRYIGSSGDDKITAEVVEAYADAQRELMDWLGLQDNRYDDELVEKIEKKEKQLYGKYLSRANYMAYMVMQYYALCENALDSVGDMTEEETDVAMVFTALTISIISGAAVSLLSIAIAVTSLVFLIRALIGIAKKRKMDTPYKYLLVMLAMTGTALIMTAVAPVLKMGGGMMAVAIFASIILAVTGVADSLLLRKEGIAVTVKRASIAVVAMVAFFLMCTNALKMESSRDMFLLVPFGYSLFCIFDMTATLLFADPAVANDIAMLMVGCLTTLIFAAIFASLAYAAMSRSFKRLVLGNVRHSSNSAFMLASAVLIFITLILQYAVFDMVYLRSQIIVSAVLMIAAFIFDLCFKVRGNNMLSDNNASANGAIADNSASANDGAPVDNNVPTDDGAVADNTVLADNSAAND